MNPLPLLPSLPRPIVADPIPFLADQLGWTVPQKQLAERLLEKSLPPLVTTSALAFVLGISAELIVDMIRQKPNYYKSFLIPKHNGYREIMAPRVALKLVQRYVHDSIVGHMKVHEAVHGFRPGRSIFSNSTLHIGASNLMTLDLLDFFGSIRSSQVSQLFLDLDYPREVAFQLSQLCTLSNALPQGAPSSPGLSNAVFWQSDAQISAYCTERDVIYSRYADDLAFSSSTYRFSSADVRFVISVLERQRFQLNFKKVRIIGGGFRHGIAGTSAGPVKAAPPRWKRRAWRALFHQALASPTLFIGRSRELAGIAAFVHAYDDNLSARYFSVAQSVKELEVFNNITPDSESGGRDVVANL